MRPVAPSDTEVEALLADFKRSLVTVERSAVGAKQNAPEG
jgi:hypothetical protein